MQRAALALVAEAEVEPIGGGAIPEPITTGLAGTVLLGFVSKRRRIQI